MTPKTYTVTDAEGNEHVLSLVETIRLGIGADPGAPPNCPVCNAKEALDALIAQIEELEREREFWRKQVGIALDAPLMIPADGPPPQEAIALGRKLMEHYGEPQRSQSTKARAEAAEQRVEELEAALEEISNYRSRYTPQTDIARTALAQSDPPED